MPKEVFAEEIELLLGTLDSIASARVFTTSGGEIAHVYVTADPSADPRTVRRSVVTALVSTYGLPVEPWRIQVTQFRGGLRPAEIPRFRVVRVEESLSATEMTATVQVAWLRGAEEKSATGRARGPCGPPSRPRTLAAATVDAVRDALDPANRRVSVQQAAFVTFLDRPVALVGISVTTPRGEERALGSAWQDETPEAVVAAALDAVTKWLLRAASAPAAPQVGDRRARLEAMRRVVRAAERGGVVLFPGSRDHVAPEDALAREAVHKADANRGPGAVAAVNEVPANPDVVTDLRQIRPEIEGGATMSVHQEPSRSGFAPSRPGRPSMEDLFYQSLVEGGTPVHLRCRDGYELPRATVKDVGTYVILVETPAGTELVFKHAIISIRLLPTQTPEA